jgi:hypothetical protein
MLPFPTLERPGAVSHNDTGNWQKLLLSLAEPLGEPIQEGVSHGLFINSPTRGNGTLLVPLVISMPTFLRSSHSKAASPREAW